MASDPGRPATLAELLAMGLSSDVVRVGLAGAVQGVGRSDEAAQCRGLARRIRVVKGRVAAGWGRPWPWRIGGMAANGGAEAGKGS